MKQQEIIEYSEEYAQQVTDLFYDAVYSISPAFYSLRQKQAWAPYPINYKWWKARLATKKPFLMLFNQAVVGFIELESDGHIDCLYVNPLYQKQGVAKRLLQYVLRVAKENALTQLNVEASIVAKSLFERFNFVVETENSINRNGVLLTNYSMRKVFVSHD